MAAVIFTPLSDAVLFMETVEHEVEIRSVLTASGYHDERHQAGRSAVQVAMDAIASAQEMQSDTSAEHLVHTAATEIEMWLQATRRRIRLRTADAALAARLILDLARLTSFAHSQGEAGVMDHTACFFKAPLAGGSHDLHHQFARLAEYAARHQSA